jgi:hypothetical protein
MAQATVTAALLAPSQCDRPRDGAFARSGLVARIAIPAARESNVRSVPQSRRWSVARARLN